MIRWDDIKINGESVAIKENYKNPFNALQGGILDTANPVNTWSGSAIEGITLAGEHEAVFEQDNPYRIDVTFTISEIEWKAPEVTSEPGDHPGNSTESNPQVTKKPDAVVTNTEVPDVTKPTVTPASKADAAKVKKPATAKSVKVKKSGRKLIISWKKIKGVTYQIVYDTSAKKIKGLKNTPKIKKIKSVNVKTNKAVINKLKKGKTYYIRVRAVKTFGGNKIYGNWSKVVKRKI